jgi:hypothetical protein
MRRRITRMLYGVATAGITFLTVGLAGAGAQAAAAAPSLGQPVYTNGQAGYSSNGRWFRFVATTVIVAPRLVPQADGGSMMIILDTSRPYELGAATIGVDPGGGPGTVWWKAPATSPDNQGTFALSPQVGDQLAVSIFYDQSTYTTLTVADLTQGVTKTVQLNTGGSLVYNAVELWGAAYNNPPPPQADTRMWKVASTRLTTYNGYHGTITGPWQTRQMIGTTTGTFTGVAVVSPSGLWNGGQNFGVWLRHR